MPLNKLVYLEERQMEDGFQKLLLHLRDSSENARQSDKDGQEH